MAKDKAVGGKKSLTNELLDDDFFKPPVESELDTPASKGAKRPAPSGGGGGPRGGGDDGSGDGSSLGRVLVLAVVALIAVTAALVFFVNPGGLRDKLLGETPARPVAIPLPPPTPPVQPPAAGANPPADPAPPVKGAETPSPAKADAKGAGKGGKTVEATPAQPAAKGADTGGKEEPKLVTRYTLQIGPIMVGLPEHEKLRQELDVLGLEFKQSDEKRVKKLHKLYINQKYETEEATSEPLAILQGLEVQAEKAPLKTGEFTLRLGTFASEAELKKLAKKIEKGSELTTVKTTETLEEIWSTFGINQGKPMKFKEDAATVQSLLKERGFEASIVEVQVPSGD